MSPERDGKVRKRRFFKKSKEIKLGMCKKSKETYKSVDVRNIVM